MNVKAANLWYNIRTMKTTLLAFAVAFTSAITLAKGQGNDKSKNWPIEDYVLDNVLVTQLDCGGWGKRVDKRKPFDEKKREKFLKNKGDADSATIDNNATTTEIRYLVRYHGAKNDSASLEAANRGIDWLLASQLANGGWPQFPARTKGYWTQITFNDNAMRNVLELMKDVADGEDDFAVFDSVRREKCRKALEKGIECVLKCQIKVDGKPTVWCQQHDRETLEPVNARAYELASFCSQESAGIVQFFMTLDNPSPEIKASVEGAVEWFRKTRLPDGKWARFYDFKDCEPLFCDRDGVPRKDLADVSKERQKGYSWYNKKGADVERLYKKWKYKK